MDVPLEQKCTVCDLGLASITLQVTDFSPFSQLVRSAVNYQMYNRIAYDILGRTEVIPWSSTIPLSRAYSEKCFQRRQTTPVSFFWKCADTMHVGYIAVEQFVEMLFNDFCNQYMSLTHDFCS